MCEENSGHAHFFPWVHSGHAHLVFQMSSVIEMLDSRRHSKWYQRGQPSHPIERGVVPSGSSSTAMWQMGHPESSGSSDWDSSGSSDWDSSDSGLGSGSSDSGSDSGTSPNYPVPSLLTTRRSRINVLFPFLSVSTKQVTCCLFWGFFLAVLWTFCVCTCVYVCMCVCVASYACIYLVFSFGRPVEFLRLHMRLCVYVFMCVCVMFVPLRNCVLCRSS